MVTAGSTPLLPVQHFNPVLPHTQSLLLLLDEHLTDLFSHATTLYHLATLSIDFGLLIYQLVFPLKVNSNFRWLGFPYWTQGKPNPIIPPSRDWTPIMYQLAQPIVQLPIHICWVLIIRLLLCSTLVRLLWKNQADSFTSLDHHLDTQTRSWSHPIRSLSFDQFWATLFCTSTHETCYRHKYQPITIYLAT